MVSDVCCGTAGQLFLQRVLCQLGTRFTWRRKRNECKTMVARSMRCRPLPQYCTPYNNKISCSYRYRVVDRPSAREKCAHNLLFNPIPNLPCYLARRVVRKADVCLNRGDFVHETLVLFHINDEGCHVRRPPVVDMIRIPEIFNSCPTFY